MKHRNIASLYPGPMASLAAKFDADFRASKVVGSSQQDFVYTSDPNNPFSRGNSSQIAKFIRDRMPRKTFIEINGECDIVKTGILNEFTSPEEFNVAFKSIIVVKSGRLRKIADLNY